MFSHLKARWLFACALLSASSIAFGQAMTERRTEITTGQEMRTGDVELARASSVIGHDVLDSKGEKIGTIKDIVLNKTGDRIEYVAFSRGELAKIHHAFVAIPLSEFTVTPATMEREGVIRRLLGEKDREFKVSLNVTKDTLEKVGVFREDGYWPSTAGRNWRTEATLEERKELNPDVLRLSKLIGREVTSERPLQMVKGERIIERLPGVKEKVEEMAMKPKIGELKDVALGFHATTPVYGEVRLTNIKDRDNFHSIVPWSALKFSRVGDKEQIALNVPDTQTLLAYGYVSDKEMPALSDQKYAEKIYTAYHQQPDWEMLGFVSPKPVLPKPEMKTEPKKY